jgi:hypothetical protein
MRYVAYHLLAGMPNIVVDGYGTDGTLLTLSHWPGSGTPAALRDDLSTQIAFRYLERPDMAVPAEAVSNNHYDEDGLCGMYALIDPDDGMRRREMLVDVASAGDFGTFRSRDAARVAMALTAYGEASRSPLPPDVFSRPYPDQTAVLYEETLSLLPAMLDDPARFGSLWADEDARLERDLERVRTNDVTIDEAPDIDLAIVTSPDPEVHQMAIHNSTERMRVLITNGARHRLYYRYETWVQYVSRPVMPRVDLTPLAARLSDEDGAPWEFDDVDDLTPSLHRAGDSALSRERFVDLVTSFLRER